MSAVPSGGDEMRWHKMLTIKLACDKCIWIARLKSHRGTLSMHWHDSLFTEENCYRVRTSVRWEYFPLTYNCTIWGIQTHRNALNTTDELCIICLYPQQNCIRMYWNIPHLNCLFIHYESIYSITFSNRSLFQLCFRYWLATCSAPSHYPIQL